MKTYDKNFDKARADYPRGDKLDTEQKAILSRLTQEEKDGKITPHGSQVLAGLRELESLEKDKIPFSSEITFTKK